MRGNGLWPLRFGGWFGFCLLLLLFGLGLLVFFSPHHVVFPSPSMMTWALRPHMASALVEKNTGACPIARICQKHCPGKGTSPCVVLFPFLRTVRSCVQPAKARRAM